MCLVYEYSFTYLLEISFIRSSGPHGKQEIKTKQATHHRYHNPIFAQVRRENFVEVNRVWRYNEVTRKVGQVVAHAVDIFWCGLFTNLKEKMRACFKDDLVTGYLINTIKSR